MRRARWAFSGFLLFVGVAVWAEVKIVNPGLAERESLEYSESIGSAFHPVSVLLTLKGQGSDARYEYHSVAHLLESTYWLDPVTLLSLSSQTRTKTADATVTRTATYEDLKPETDPGDLILTDMGSLPVVLRGFPWTTVKLAKIVFVGNANFATGGVSFDLRVVGQDAVTTAGRVWQCWHVTTGLEGPLNLVVPRTDWWFAVEGTHPLIKSSGPAGGPGSPTRTLLLNSYHIEK